MLSVSIVALSSWLRIVLTLRQRTTHHAQTVEDSIFNLHLSKKVSSNLRRLLGAASTRGNSGTLNEIEGDLVTIYQAVWTDCSPGGTEARSWVNRRISPPEKPATATWITVGPRLRVVPASRGLPAEVEWAEEQRIESMSDVTG